MKHALTSLYRRFPVLAGHGWHATCACGWQTSEDHTTKDGARSEVESHIWHTIAADWNEGALT